MEDGENTYGLFILSSSNIGHVYVLGATAIKNVQSISFSVKKPCEVCGLVLY